MALEEINSHLITMLSHLHVVTSKTRIQWFIRIKKWTGNSSRLKFQIKNGFLKLKIKITSEKRILRSGIPLEREYANLTAKQRVIKELTLNSSMLIKILMASIITF